MRLNGFQSTYLNLDTDNALKGSKYINEKVSELVIDGILQYFPLSNKIFAQNLIWFALESYNVEYLT